MKTASQEELEPSLQAMEMSPLQNQKPTELTSTTWAQSCEHTGLDYLDSVLSSCALYSQD
jgi:hypothetical protein